MNKKLILIITSIVLVVALLVIGVMLFLGNIGNCKIAIESKTALQGDAVSIPISISKNHGLYYGRIIINYDSDALSFVSCANGEVFEECEANNLDGQLVLMVNQTGVENTKIDGVMATLNFKVNETAPKGNYDINFEINQESPDDATCFVNVSEPENFIAFEHENGKITVK